ncbi:ubiquitin carboxyl-terminal hydrolase 10 [Diachasmimorpha longicaudata]|uniref:ubiquitin carboxyl-terminal hydrolase 10 n=1 Tax=Diachasmimorpha longicaudata TaxID=58733 RepID=UPI0030B8A274
MDIKSTLDYEFINLDNLDDNVKREIRTILKTKIASDVLKLPWDNGEKDYNSNSVVPEMQPEVLNHWQRYDESIPSYDVSTPPSMLASPMSTLAYPTPPLMQVPFQDWQMTTAYPTTTSDPTTYTYVSSVHYPTPIYNPAPNEVLTTQSPSRETRHSGRSRNRKNDNYNRSVTNDMQQSYMIQPGQFNPIPAMCHPGVQYLPYVSTQQHPAAGRPIFMPPQYSQIHHNSHQYHQHPSNYHQPSPTIKHQRQNAQNYNPMYNQEKMANQGLKNDKKNSDNQRNTASQPFRQLLNHKNNNNHNNNANNKVERDSGEVVKEIPKRVEDIQESISTSNGIVNGEKYEGGEVGNEVAAEVILEVAKASEESTKKEETVVNDIEEGMEEIKTNGEQKGEEKDLPVMEEVKELERVPVAPAAKTFASIVKSTEGKNPPGFVQSPGVKLPSAVRANVDCVNNGIEKGEVKGEEVKRQSEETMGAVAESTFGETKALPVDHVQTPLNHPLMYRMGEFLLRYQMDKQTVSLLPRGLTNRSNYCYINSILQALLACPPFYNLLRALPRSRYPLKNSSTPLIDNMVKFVNEFLPLPEGERLPRNSRGQKKNDDSLDIKGGTAFEPSYVYTMLKNTSSPGVFSIEGRQEDAEEFLSCLLNGISDEMLELMKQVSEDSQSVKPTEELNANYNSGDEEWKVMGPKNKGSITRCIEFGRTPLSDIFRGQLRSRILRQGDQSTDNVQPFFTLQLDIEKAESVKAALEILVGRDLVEGMTCSKTKQQIQAWKQVTLEELPVVLILHLKWFDYKLDGCSKIFKNVAYDIDLKIDAKLLSLNTQKKLSVKQKQYKLFAVTYHDGKEATKGHYVTDAFHVGFGAWVRYDDSSVKGISENDVLNPSPPRVPYLLYYRRCDTIGNQPNTTRTR